MMLPYEIQREVELFLLREAKLLDAGAFESWLSLYAPEGIYWMPSQPGQTDPKGVASIIYEDHAILAIRVRRLQEARALVLTPMHRAPRISSAISKWCRAKLTINSPQKQPSFASSTKAKNRDSIRDAKFITSSGRTDHSALR